MPSVPRRAAPIRPAACPVDTGHASGPVGDSPARALQRHLADRWTPAVALPETSGAIPRIESLIAATSRIGGPILFGATLAAIATALT